MSHLVQLGNGPLPVALLQINLLLKLLCSRSNISHESTEGVTHRIHV